MKSKYPNWRYPFPPFKDRNLVIHRGSLLSVRVKRGRKWRWEHGLTEITQTDIRRLPKEDQARIRRLEERRRVKLVVADHDWTER